MKRKDTGARGEKLARDFLKKQGYKILDTNYRCPQGEIDIVARHKDTLAFIEVRTKTSLEYGSPEESITSVKKERMRVTAAHYQQTHSNLPQSVQINLVAVELTSEGELSRIELIENAVGG